LPFLFAFICQREVVFFWNIFGTIFKIIFMKTKLFFILFIFTIVCKTFAQPGTLDATFNPIDQLSTDAFGTNGKVNVTATLSDGKIIVAGQFTTFNITSCNSIVRLNSDGTIDPTFNVGTGTNATINNIDIQNDGKIIIVGQFTTYNGTTCNYIARLNSDGTLDSTFNAGTNDKISTIKIQNDGKIIIGGYFTICNGSTSNYLARLNSDGTLDTTFITGADNVVSTISVQSDGKIIIGGQFNFYNSVASNYIARLNSNGTLDSTFNSGAGADNFINTTTIQSDGKIIIGGSFTNFNAISRNFIARLNTNGSLDISFNPGSGPNQPISCVSIQNNGKIIIAGIFTTYNGATSQFIACLSSSGTLDTTYNSGAFTAASGTTGIVNSIYIQNDGKIICGGAFSRYNDYRNSNIIRLNADGTLDTSFNPYTGASYKVQTISIQNDDKIIIGGDFKTFNGIASKYIARLNSDGSLDSTFNIGNGFDVYVRSSAIQSDGKILIGGDFTSYNGINKNGIVRLNTDGSLDLSFNSPSEAVTIRSMCIQSDGKIIISGGFTTYNGIARNGIARLNSNGSVDSTFNPGTGAVGIYCIQIQSNGKILIGGNFTSYNGTARGRIARLNADGSIDAAFNSASGASGSGSSVFSIAIQSDNKIIIGGSFTSYNGSTAGNLIARLYSDGTLDSSFTNSLASITVNFSVNSIKIQNDGKIIVGTNVGVKRLNIDGSLDSNFTIIYGSDTRCANLQSDGKIIIGQLATWGALCKHYVARLIGGSALANSDFEKENIVIYPNPTKDFLHIDLQNELSGKITDLTGKTVMNVNSKDINISSLRAGIYLLDISSEGKRYTSKIIKE
jgi:uncharacterized delta-60 repeat protein